MSDEKQTLPAPLTAQPDLHPEDAANAAALADAGVTKPSDLGAMQAASAAELTARVELLERQMAYLRGTYVREAHFPTE